ncbi:glycosyltransferase family 4 protein [Larkinella rosea]|nr:glycosyltransferase family 4 protein [Larkinella rosea]
MNQIRQSVTAHAGARDQYQLSLALHEADWLDRLVTELYVPDWLYQTAPSYARKRYCQGLPASKINHSLPAFWKTACAHAFHRDYNSSIDQEISLTALRTAEKTGSNLFLYSYYAFQAFQQAEKLGIPHRILFQLHPHPSSVRSILAQEMDRLPFASQSIRDEVEFSLADSRLDGLIAEPQLATFCLTASQFTRKTLIENGVPASRIKVVPYGVDTTAFPQRKKAPSTTPFRIIFVGRMNQRKGLADLLQAVRLLKSRSIEVVLCGRGYIDQPIINEYKDLTITLHKGIGTEQLVRELHRSHVFVLPSLAEGFAHVVLEAMATGLPVITTENTCGPDVITEGKHGYLVPIRNPERLAAVLDAAMAEPKVWYEMGRQAAIQARTYTWERFRQGIREVYQEIVKSN